MLVIHENRGLNDHIRSVAGRLAASGYSALAIDLLSAEGGTAALGDEAEATAALSGAPQERFVADMRAGLDELERRAPGQKLGAIGFCFGGGMVWTLLASGEPRLAAAAPFYGPLPDGADFSGSPNAAVLGIYAEQDDAGQRQPGGGHGRARTGRADPRDRHLPGRQPRLLQRHRPPLRPGRGQPGLRQGARLVRPAPRLTAATNRLPPRGGRLLCWFPVDTLNLGILAHVDAGKTSLTERLLYAAGVIDEIGSVDDGSTQTDSLALERQRGITIKSAVVSFVVDDVTVNLIDTPGHPDFIAEVERVLSVLDGAVLVVSAVEGVQAQTRVLMRTLQRLRIPTLHLRQQDRPRRRAGRRACCATSPSRLTPAIVAMGVGQRPGHPRRRVHAVRRRPTPASPPGWPSCSPTTTTRCWPRTSTTRPRCSYRRLRARAGARRPGGRWCIRCSSARRSPARAWTR